MFDFYDNNYVHESIWRRLPHMVWVVAWEYDGGQWDTVGVYSTQDKALSCCGRLMSLHYEDWADSLRGSMEDIQAICKDLKESLDAGCYLKALKLWNEAATDFDVDGKDMMLIICDAFTLDAVI